MFKDSRLKAGSRLWLPVFVALLLITGCAYGSSAFEAPAEPGWDGAAEVEKRVEAEYMSVADEGDAYSSSGAAYEYTVQEHLIIRNANLAIVVDDTTETVEAIRGLVAQLEGWEVHSNLWEYSGVMRGTIQVRVPTDQLDAFLDTIRDLANEVTNESISGQDVTEEYVDIQAQLSNLEATRDRVRNFLDEAKNVEEALQVNYELSRLEGEIERLSGRKQYLEGAARYSSVEIDITPDELAQPVTIAGWRPEGTARDAIQALIKTVQWLVDVLIFVLLYLAPVALIIGLPIVLFVRYIRRRRNRRREAAAQEATEE